MPGTALLIDADNCLHRIFAGGEPEAAALLLDFANAYVQRYTKPGHNVDVVLCLDCDGPCWRKKVWPAYKEGRGPKPPGLDAQKAKAAELFERAGWFVDQEDDQEADDLIATNVRNAIENGWRAVIRSNDSDLWQLLLEGRVTALIDARRWHGEWQFADFAYFRERDLKEKHGLTPAQWLDYKILAGDPGDGWKGAPGIGEETAKRLLREAGSLEAARERPYSTSLSERKHAALLTFPADIGRRLLDLRTTAYGTDAAATAANL